MTDKKELIIKETIREYSSGDSSVLSMRNIASNVGISQSVIYHYFPSKEILLRETFDYCRKELGRRRQKLEDRQTVEEMFRDRIKFQLDNSDLIITILKYYTDNPDHFKKQDHGYLPPKSALHIVEILERGRDEGIYSYDDLIGDSKVIAHSINGFVTEYHGHKITNKEKEKLVDEIALFFERGLKK